MYISYLKSRTPEEHPIKKFLEYDTIRKQIYDNLFLDDCKILVKVSIPQKSNSKENVEIGRFKICGAIFLTSY
ncbi:MAG: hypothetical protein ACFFFB_20780 [Candidatus Heimdallarchaeota archaeon]